MDFNSIISAVLKAGVAGASGDKDGHDFRGNQWTVMGPWGQPVPRPRDPQTNKPLKGQALADELKRLYPSASTPIPKTGTTAKPAPPKIQGTPKAPKATPTVVSAPTPTPSPAPAPKPQIALAPAPIAPPVAPTPPVVAPTPAPAPPAPEPAPPVVEEKPKPEPKASEKTYATVGEMPIAERCAFADKWKPEGELEEKAQKSGLDLARRLGVPKERRALFAMNLTNILTKPDEFRAYDKAAKEIKSGDDQHTGAALLAMIGYTGLPHIVDEATFRAAEGKVTYSGLSTRGGSSQTIQQKLATLYTAVFPRYGHNMFGVAFYTGEKSTAAAYATQGTRDNAIFRVKMAEPENVYTSDNGPMLKTEVVRADANQDHGKSSAFDHPDYEFRDILNEAGYTDQEHKQLENTLFGRGDNETKSITPALAGYDAYYASGHNYRMVLNRGAMILPDTYATNISGTSSFDAGGAVASNSAKNVGVDAANAVIAQALADRQTTSNVAKGEGPGHVFHGNQYQMGAGHGNAPINLAEDKNTIIGELSSKMALPTKTINQSMMLISPYLEAARRAEPEITKAINEVVAESLGTRAREGYAVKSLKSSTEKVLKDTFDKFHDEALNHMESAASQVHDLVRYTITWEPKDIAKGAQAAIDGMRARGFLPYVDNGVPYIKNYFHGEPGNSYRGINANFVDPNNGQVFEVQFHTPQSLQVAEEQHPVYDQLRKLDPKSPEYIQGQADMQAAFDRVLIPPGIGSVGRLTYKKSIV